jgi:hypothetical protein
MMSVGQEGENDSLSTKANSIAGGRAAVQGSRARRLPDEEGSLCLEREVEQDEYRATVLQFRPFSRARKILDSFRPFGWTMWIRA